MSPLPRTRIERGLAGLLALLLLLATSGCGALGFRSTWANFEPTAEGGPMEGRWEGEWKSDWNGHEGGLRCVMTRQDEEHYLARFLSTYAGILSFRHDNVFHVTSSEGGTLRFEGEQDLGEAFGGVYHYLGTVTPDPLEGDRFEATYEAANGDHGTFRMKRTPEKAPDS